MQNNEKILDISWKTILKIAVAVIVFYILFSVRQIIVWFIFALTISLLFNPAIDFLHKKKIPRPLAVIVIYLSIFGILSLLIYMMIPIFINEMQRFLDFFPQYFEKIAPPLKGLGLEAFGSLEDFFNSIEGFLTSVAKNVFTALFAVFGGIFTTLFVIVTAVFLSLEGKAVENSLILLFPKKYEAQVLAVWQRCQKKVASWFGGRVLACLFVGVASYISFLIFSVRYPFTLALFAGVFNFVPYVGPIFTAVLLFLIVFPTSPVAGVFIIIVFIVIQQIENNILSPLLMKKFVGLPPVLVLFSLVVGATLWGGFGAILAVPLFGILFEFLKEFLQKRRDRNIVTV